MPDIKNRLFRFYLKHWFPPIFTKQRSIKEQQQNLQGILQSVRNTALGNDVGLKNVHSYDEYRSTVPLTEYSFYEKYIERIKQGEQKVMCAERVRWFGKTAGTTSGKSKLIPITRSIVRHCHVRGTFYGLSILHRYDSTVDILNHKNYALSGGVYETLPSGITVGDISGIMMRNIPLPFRSIYVPNNALMTASSWQEKLTQIPDAIKDADVGNMIGIPTWHLAVLRQLHDKLKFNKLTDVWKNLRIFFHGGVNFEPYRQQFIDLIGRKDFIFYEIYNATEGFFGAQAKLYETGMLLLTDTSIFYEFIPFADYNTDRAKAIDVSEVQVGVPYVIVISAPNGLLRYVIGDVITFTSTEPYTFNITGRTQEYINAFGEDLMLGHVSNALMEANKLHGCSIKEYTVAPHYIQLEEKGKIQFLIEFETAPSDIAAYEAELDMQLQLQNSNYAQKRNNNIALSPLQVIVAKPNLFYNWLESKGKLGGQNKMPRLVNGRQIIDALLDMNH